MTEKNKHHSELIFKRENYIIMIIGLVVIALGFMLMSGGGSDDPNIFDDSVFSFQRIRLAPTLVLIGFAIEVVAILYNPKKKQK